MPPTGGNPGTFNVRWFAVLVVDLLGQKDQLHHWRRPPETPAEVEGFRAAVRNSAGHVHGFGNAIANWHAGWSGPPQVDLPSLLKDPADRARYDRYRAPPFKLQRFSDLILCYCPLADAGGMPNAAGVERMLLTGAWAMRAALSVEVPLRGGLTVGTGLELDDGFFYGPALAIAHQLENEVAKWPRIVVDDEVRAFLRGGAGFPHDRKLDQIQRGFAQEADQMLAVDVEDGRLILDYLGRAAAEELRDDEFTLEGIRKTRAWVDRVIAERSKAGDTKLLDRYQRLGRYIESRAGHWPQPTAG